MRIHVTEVGTWKRCRRQWYWTSPSAQNREPYEYRGALALGTLIHSALDYWFQNPADDPVSFFLDDAHGQREGVEAEYLHRVGAPMSDSEREPIQKDIDLGKGLLTNYVAYYHQPLPAGWTVVASEHEFEIPILDEHFLCGRFDKVLADPYGRLYIADHKTFSTHPSEESLQENEQFRRYAAAARLLYPDREVMGFFYDGLWKRGSVPKGRTMDDLFMRRMLHFNKASLKEIWLDTVLIIADEIVSQSSLADAQPNRTWTCAIDCASAIRSLCTAQTHGDDLGVLKDRLTRVKVKGEKESEPVHTAV